MTTPDKQPSFYGTPGTPEGVLLPPDHPNGQTPCMRALRQVLAERDTWQERAEYVSSILGRLAEITHDVGFMFFNEMDGRIVDDWDAALAWIQKHLSMPPEQSADERHHEMIVDWRNTYREACKERGLEMERADAAIARAERAEAGYNRLLDALNTCIGEVAQHSRERDAAVAAAQQETDQLRQLVFDIRAFHNNYKGLALANNWAEIEEQIDAAIGQMTAEQHEQGRALRAAAADQETCAHCAGTGRSDQKVCSACNGSGVES